MEKLVISDFKLGITAGGQLGKMLVLAASNRDVKTYVLDPDEHCPATRLLSINKQKTRNLYSAST